MTEPEHREMRRTIPQRDTGWARRLARWLQRLGATPNSISIMSVVVSAVGAAALVASAHVGPSGRIALLLVAALAPPLRLLSNMLDGMLAVEGGMQSATGDLYNEVPDRISDVLLIAAAGYAVATFPGAVTLGWVAATLAVLTAYVRSLGAAQGLSNHFEGPLSKPRRMWLLDASILLTAAEPLTQTWGVPPGAVMMIGLGLISVGSLATVIIRLRHIAAELDGRN